MYLTRFGDTIITISEATQSSGVKRSDTISGVKRSDTINEALQSI